MMMNMLMEMEATRITGGEKGVHTKDRNDYRSGTGPGLQHEKSILNLKSLSNVQPYPPNLRGLPFDSILILLYTILLIIARFSAVFLSSTLQASSENNTSKHQ